MRDFSLSLGDALKCTREKLGLSQRKVAEDAGIDTRTVLEIENYRGNPKLEVLYPLVRATTARHLLSGVASRLPQAL